MAFRKFIHTLTVTLVLATSIGTTAFAGEHYKTENLTVPKTNMSADAQGRISLYADNTAELVSHPYMIGRLYSNTLKLNTALYDTRTFSGVDKQLYVDYVDSAAVFYCGTQCTVADHTDQGFSSIRNAVPNQTIIYIQKGTYTDAYLCTEIGEGHNLGTDLVDANGNSIKTRNDGSLFFYTCNGCWQNVSYAVWKQIPIETAIAMDTSLATQ